MDATPGPVESFTYDALGNTVALTDASGTPTQTTLYNAFGTVVVQTGSSTNDRLHNTKEHDASTGLDNYGMRYYDESTGTFITRDPSGYGDGLNVYLNVHDDPVNSVDPQGLQAWYQGWGGAISGLWNGDTLNVGSHFNAQDQLVYRHTTESVQDVYDRAVWDRTHGAGDAIESRLQGGPVSVGGVTFNGADRSDEQQVAGQIVDATKRAVAAVESGGKSEIMITAKDLLAQMTTGKSGGGSPGNIPNVPGDEGDDDPADDQSATDGANSNGTNEATGNVTPGQGTAPEATNAEQGEESGPYSNIPDPRNVGPGKDFTPATKQKILEQNRAANGGVLSPIRAARNLYLRKRANLGLRRRQTRPKSITWILNLVAARIAQLTRRCSAGWRIATRVIINLWRLT